MSVLKPTPKVENNQAILNMTRTTGKFNAKFIYESPTIILKVRRKESKHIIFL